MKQSELQFQTIVFWLLDLLAVLIGVRLAAVVFQMIPDAAYERLLEGTILFAALFLYTFAFFWRIGPVSNTGSPVKFLAANLGRKCAFLLIGLFIVTGIAGSDGKRMVFP